MSKKFKDFCVGKYKDKMFFFDGFMEKWGRGEAGGIEFIYRVFFCVL